MSAISRALRGASVVALCCATPSLANPDEEPQRRDVVVTGQRPPDTPTPAPPGGADVVAATDYEDKLAVSLRDALAWSPGVYAQPRYGQEVRISIRGSDISRGAHLRGLLILQDGVPINLADNNGDFQELDPLVLDRIEVLRGGNALRLGGSALGGAINGITPTGRTAPRLAVRVDGGSADTLRAFASLGFATERGDAFLALTTDRSNGDRQHARRSALRFNGNVGLRLSDRVETRLYATVNRIGQDIPGFLTRDQALTTPQIALPERIAQDHERNMDSIRLQSRTTVQLGGGSIMFGGFLSTKDLDHPIFGVLDQKSVDGGGFARVELTGEVAGLPVEATLGTTARFGTVHARQFTNVAGRRGVLTAQSRQAARTIDSYAEARVTPSAGLQLIAGIVYSHGRREVENLRTPQRSGTATFDELSPKLGLLYGPSSAVQFYANVSRSVELPGFAELNQTPFANGGVVAPGFVPLAPQRAWTLEVGTRGRRGIASWDLTFYRADLRGELLQFAQAPDVPAATFNAGRTRHQGIEAGLDLNLARFLRLRSVYQLNDFRFRNDAQYADNRLPVVPMHQLRAELRVGTTELHLAPNVEWVPRGGWADYVNTYRPDGYLLIGVTAAATLRPGLELFADARNIAGEKAIGDVSAATRWMPASVIFYPVERQQLFVGLRARL